MTPVEHLSQVRQGLGRGSYVRSVNFHNTPAYRTVTYRRQLAWYARHFTGVNDQELTAFLTTGRWQKCKPGLILAFYNGYRNNFDVMKPLLDHYGFTGWFFVPTDFVNAAPKDQRAFAAGHNMRVMPEEHSGDRLALSWDELRVLDCAHVVASHTKTHTKISHENVDALREELIGPQLEFAKQLGHHVRALAWLWGSPFGVFPVADKLVLEAHYSLLFSNYKIQRVQAQDGLDPK